MRKLLDLGFEIKFDNTIHLKLYITDNETFVTSSNLTQAGFESNVELTIKVDSENSIECGKIFDEIWYHTGDFITYELLQANWLKYQILRRRSEFSAKIIRKPILDTKVNTDEIDIKKLINDIYNLNRGYPSTLDLVFEANQIKNKFKTKLEEGFNSQIFYVESTHSQRRNNLFYDLTYGYEARIANTGLRELQFKTAFLHKEFVDVIHYVLPELVSSKPWNLYDKDELFTFCHGLFTFKIPHYTEALPIRIASYFYPEHFLPIFKLEHLKQICNALNIETNAKTKGERFFAYTSHILDNMKHLPCDNSVKSKIAYTLLFTVDVHKRLCNGKTYDNILSDYKQIWKQHYISKSFEILNKLNLIKSIPNS